MKLKFLLASIILCVGMMMAMAQTPVKPVAPGTKPTSPAAKPATTPTAKPTATTITPPKITKDTNWMRDAIKHFYNDCSSKHDYRACDSCVYWGTNYFNAIKTEDAYAAYMRCVAAFHKINNTLSDESHKSQTKSSSSGIKNIDATIKTLPIERKDELLKMAEAALVEINWFINTYNNEDKAGGRLQDVKQKQYMIEDYIKKLKM
jgi:hypothetical protein